MFKKTLFLLCVFTVFSSAFAEESTLHLYHDADWSNHPESAESIWRGVQLALSEVDYRVQGYQLALQKKNHSGNVTRSLKNNKAFLADPKALALISGIHSPPLIKNRQFINENKVLTLVPWAAGGPITRYSSGDNWVFRLSVDDTKAGAVLVNYAVSVKGCKKPHLLLERSPWGDSNLKNMSAALAAKTLPDPDVTRFSWNLKAFTASDILLKISASGADCILFVANALEGVQFADAMAGLNSDKRLPIVSHWGITAGDFHEKIDAEKRTQLDLSFIQSCFSFHDAPLSDKGKEVLNKAMLLYPEAIKGPSDIRSPVGFIHGYDLTKLLLAAIDTISLGDDAVANRALIRSALEKLDKPISGLVKTYQQPFDVYSESNPDAHEALGKDDYCMAYYDKNNNIILRK